MKISKLYIHDFQQFKEFELDFTYPKGHEKAGQPLEKVCFIGANGTGKTTILNVINSYVGFDFNLIQNGYLFELMNKDVCYIKVRTNNIGSIAKFFDKKLLGNYKLNEIFGNAEQTKFGLIHLLSSTDSDQKFYTNAFLNTHFNFIISEDIDNASHFNDLQDLPKVSLNDALKIENSKKKEIISNLTIREFWKNLIYSIKKRESDYIDFQNKPENQSKTLKEVKEIFEQNNPTIIDKIALLWDKILAKAGLELDKENIKNPVQLTDNLHAYIKLKSTGERISYHQLSTGIRNYIFKIGHLYSIYFNKNVESGILLFDEPENSLFPDFLYDIIETYQNVTPNTQLFVATHNPIVASQFESFERFILEFDENGKIKVLNGVAPIGDDANDILYKDFGMRSIYGKEGLKNWERFVELKSLIKSSQNVKEKAELADEFLKIGTKYNFQINGVS